MSRTSFMPEIQRQRQMIKMLEKALKAQFELKLIKCDPTQSIKHKRGIIR